MGLGPSGIGDQICILYGYNKPLLIRPLDHGQHLVVGNCYIYGMMNGEMVDEIGAGSLKTETLHFK